MKTKNLFGLLILSSLYFNTAFAENTQQRYYNIETTNFIGQVAPNFKITTSDNNVFLLSEEAGRQTLILCFVSTQSFSSAPFLKKMQSIKTRCNKKPVKFILISQDYSDLVKSFLDRNGFDFVFYSDTNKILTKQFKIEEPPGIAIIGVDGRMQLHASGIIPNNIEKYVNKVIKTNLKLLRKKQNIKTAKEYFTERFKDIDRDYKNDYKERMYNKIKCPCLPYLSLAECYDCPEADSINDTFREYFRTFRLIDTGTSDKTLAEKILQTNVEFLTD